MSLQSVSLTCPPATFSAKISCLTKCVKYRMSQFMTNPSGNFTNNNLTATTAGSLSSLTALSVNGTVTGSGISVWSQLLSVLSGFRLELTSVRDTVINFLRNQFSFNGGLITNIINRLRLTFPMLQGVAVGLFIEDVVSGINVTQEQIAIFNTVPLRILIGRRLRVVSPSGLVTYIILTINPDLVISAGVRSLVVNIEPTDNSITGGVIVANSFIFLEPFSASSISTAVTIDQTLVAVV